MNDTTTAATRFFRFGGILDLRYQAMAPQLADMEDALNDRIPTSEFSSALERLYFIPVIVPDEQRAEHAEVCFFDASEKKLLIQKHVMPGEDLLQVLAREVEKANDEALAFPSLVWQLAQIIGEDEMDKGH